jgi:CRP-like cAMP-binding protein
MAHDDDTASRTASMSSALMPVFRGRFCDILLAGRTSRTFDEKQVIYELGDRERLLYFVQRGIAKVGTVTDGGREIIYDLRKDGDVMGELCCLGTPRWDRAVALERTEAIPVSFDEALAALAQHPVVLAQFLDMLCRALSEAYDQVNRLAGANVEEGVVEVLRKLAGKLGQPAGEFIEIPVHLTQEELSQMVVARRERVSTALNSLRRSGIAHYSQRGHLLVNLRALEQFERKTAPTTKSDDAVLPR